MTDNNIKKYLTSKEYLMTALAHLQVGRIPPDDRRQHPLVFHHQLVRDPALPHRHCRYDLQVRLSLLTVTCRC